MAGRWYKRTDAWQEIGAASHMVRLQSVPGASMRKIVNRKYYIDFMEKKETRIFAEEIARQLRGEKENIRRIYGESYVAAGDKARMKVMLAMPGGYYRIVKLYDKFIIPLRNRKRKHP